MLEAHGEDLMNRKEYQRLGRGKRFFIHMILDLNVKGRNLDAGKLFCSTSSVQALPLDVTTPRNSYAWNYRKLATLLTLSESLAEVGLEPLTIGSMRKNLTIELS